MGCRTHAVQKSNISQRNSPQKTKTKKKGGCDRRGGRKILIRLLSEEIGWGKIWPIRLEGKAIDQEL